MRAFNLVGLVFCWLVSGASFVLIDYATSQGILFLAAVSVAFFVAGVTFIQTDRVESKIDALDRKLYGPPEQETGRSEEQPRESYGDAEFGSASP